MAKKKQKEAESFITKIKDVDEDDIINNICPTCGVEVKKTKCRLCGARKTVNDVSGNVIWMRNGRIVRAFHDERDAYLKMAARYLIPRKRWPKEFR